MLKNAQTNQKSTSERILDFIVGIVWAAVAGGYLFGLRQEQTFTGFGLFVFYTLVAISFVRRKPALTRPLWWENGLALIGIFLPIFGFQSITGGGNLLSSAMVVISLVGMVFALIALGRSFGIAPADRGVVSSGFYRVVRHPLYAFETIFYIGYLIGNFSLLNFLVAATLIVVAVIRIYREERIISGYASYAERVRWRLVPFIW